MTLLRRATAAALIVSTAALSLPQPSYAGMITTADATSAAASAPRARLADLLNRAEVRAALSTYGVSQDAVQARVAALSDEEAAAVAGKLDALPAGGDAGLGAIVGAAVLVFLVLLLTDILGFTHVFPFTKPIKR
jgi:hypothetical protein